MIKQSPTVSLGRSLPGMQNVSRNVHSNISVSRKTLELIQQESKLQGAIKVEIGEDEIRGTKLTLRSHWVDSMDMLRNHVDDNSIGVFILFRKSKDVILVKYIPDSAPSKVRMVCASSMVNVKGGIQDSIPGVTIEEYNVTDAKELMHKVYCKYKNVKAPLLPEEILKKEDENAETAGAYSMLARLSTSPQVALCGMNDSRSLASKTPKNQNQGNKPIASKSEKTPTLKTKSNDSTPKNSLSRPKSNSSIGELVSKRTPANATESSDNSGIQTASAGDPKVTTKLDQNSFNKKSKDPSSSLKGVKSQPNKVRGVYKLETLIAMAQLDKFGQIIDPETIEMHMINSEFVQTFGMTKEEFGTIPEWRKRALKKKAGLIS